MNLRLGWTRDGWTDYIHIQNDKRLLKKVNALIEDILRNGSHGLGKPEILKGDMQGWFSRRIDKDNRLVYRLNADILEIAQCCTHYHK